MSQSSDVPVTSQSTLPENVRLKRRPSIWRGSFRSTIAVAIFGAVLFAIGTAFAPEVVSRIWYARVVDVVVVTAILLTGAVAVQFGRRDRKARDFAKSPEFAIVTSCVLLATLFVTYASFRNQTRLAAETGLNEEAMQLYQLETSHPELRCLYDNYGHSDPNSCLAKMASNSDAWSLGIFYVEEAWYVLDIARVDERQWGSTYSDSIEFWRNDVGKDPTGLFSYYLVATEEDFEGARRVMRRAGVEIEHLCRNYRKVWAALRRHSANPVQLVHCVPEPI